MSNRARRCKYFVPELPLEYISDFGEQSNTTEGSLLRLLLQDDASASASPAPVLFVKGAGGTGKTTSLMGLGRHLHGLQRFSKAIWFTSLGRDANPSVLFEDLETVVRAVVGECEASEIARLSKLQNKASAVAEAVQVLNDHDVLLLLDDVWADEQARDVGQCTVFSLVQDISRLLQHNPGHLRVVISTRDSRVAAMIPERCHVVAGPFERGDVSARKMLCGYAHFSFEDVQCRSSDVQKSFDDVLNRCGGLQLALAIAGRSVFDRVASSAARKEEVWSVYAGELAEMQTFLKTSHPDHPAVYTMLQSSLKHLSACLEKDGVVLHDDLELVFSCLGVMRKQDAVPISVVECIWGLPKEETFRLCIDLQRLHLVSVTEQGGMQCIYVHDLVLEFCDTVMGERPGRKAFVHRMVVERVENNLLGVAGLERAAMGGFTALSKLFDVDVETCLRDYCVRNIGRHMSEAGDEYLQGMLYLITDYRWIEAHMLVSRQGNDLSGFMTDLETVSAACENKMDKEVKRGLRLLSDAARLSMGYIGSNPRELSYQLEGRLNAHTGLNKVVDRFVWSLDKRAKRPRLKPGKGVLKTAGGPVILNVSLPKALHCIAVLPNGEDVIVGGEEAYLAVFSIRYASKLRELHGHQDAVSCVAVCSVTNRVFTGSQDSSVWVWKLGSGQPDGHMLVKHKSVIMSLALTADGKQFVFGDPYGWLVVCDSTSGDVVSRKRGHQSTIYSLSIRQADGMIASSSEDGTVAFWDSRICCEVGRRFSLGDGNDVPRVMRVMFSRDGRRIVFASLKKAGVIEVGNWKVLRECDLGCGANAVTFASDDQTVYMGFVNGTTITFLPNGNIVREVKAHSAIVGGLVLIHANRLLVSVSSDCTLSVQSLDRLNDFTADERTTPFTVWKFVALPDRKRILCNWADGLRDLKLLEITKSSADMFLSEEGLNNASTEIGNSDANRWVTAVAASPCGTRVAIGTGVGELAVYDTQSWRTRYQNLRRMRGIVWTAAISNDGCFLAGGSEGGDVGLFRFKDGGEVQLPSSDKVNGRVIRVIFSEDSSTLLAFVQDPPAPAGTLHIWKYIDQHIDIRHVDLAFDKTSPWLQPSFTMAAKATTSHIALHFLGHEEICVYDVTRKKYTLVSTTEQEASELLQLAKREHDALEVKGALFMRLFGRPLHFESIVLSLCKLKKL